MRKRVLIIQKTISQYRRRFFELLRAELDREGIDLTLAYGRPEPDEATKGDVVRLDWAVERPTYFVPVGKRRLYWQSCLSLVPGADLVIVEQASKLLVNYPLFALHLAGAKRLAFWGHGRTPKATPPSHYGEAAKAFMSRHVHWWFAYNELSAGYVRELGFPEGRITVVQNAIDTRALVSAAAAVDAARVSALAASLGLSGRKVGLFVGGVYREKRLPFLIAACELIKQRVPEFEMVFIGSGPDRPFIDEAAARNKWMRALGPMFDDEKVPYFKLARVVLMPGAVGLGILDSFALGTPTVTTCVPYHGPEVEYLRPGANGVVVQDCDSPALYADDVAALLHDDAHLTELQAGCRESAALYTAEEMVRRFAEGVKRALQLDDTNGAPRMQHQRRRRQPGPLGESEAE